MVRRAALGCLVTLAAGAAGAQDLLLMRDGSRRAGALQSCVAERCYLGGEPVERAEIAWIGLAAAGGTPPTAVDPQRDEVHLADGSTELGTVVGISLGAVALESASFDRREVAWVRFAGEDAAHDVLILRSGESRLGELAGCAGESCSFDGAPHPRSSIAWIGLGRAAAAPPAPTDAAGDEIHLTDDTVEPGPVVGIGAGSVVGQRGSYPREEVAWVYLAPAQTDRSGLPDQFGAPAPDAPAPDPAGGAADAPDTGGLGDAPPLPPAPPGGYAPTGEPEIGPLWTGTAEASWVAVWDDATARDSTTVDPVRLREHRYPLLIPGPGGGLERVGTYLDLRSEGTVLTTRSSLTMPLCSISGSGAVTLLPEDEGGIHVFIKTVDVDTTPGVGWNVPLGRGRYFGGFSADQQRTGYTVSGCGDSEEENFGVVGFGKSPVPLPEILATAADPQPRYLEAGGGRMSGSYSGRVADGTLTVSWNICREGVSCAGPPSADEPPPDEDDCPEVNQERALMDPIWNQRQLRADQMAADWNQLEAAAAEVQDNLEAWQTAISACAISEIVLATLTQGATKAAGSLGQAIALARKILSGDLSYLVQSDNVGLLLDLFKATMEASGAGDPANMRAKLESCGGSLPDGVYDAARDFVDGVERVNQLKPQVQESINHIRNLDDEYWNQWHQAYQTCLQLAECEGRPATDCEAPPETPSGPISDQETSAPTPPPSW